LNDSVEQNPTPGDDGGASTLDPLDRLEKYLSAGSGSDDGQGEDQGQSAQEDVKPDGDGQQSDEPQLTTSDLAKYLGIEEGALDLDEDGTVKLKTKVDGVEGAAKLQDLLKSYQLQEHVDKKSRDAAEREKALQARAQEAEQQFTQKLQYAENLTNIAAQQLLQEFQSIDWNALEQHDAGQAALLRQKYQERHAQLQGVHHSLQNEKARAQQQTEQQRQKLLATEAERLPQVIPEWQDAATATKERGELRDWALKQGISAQDLESVVYASHVAVMRKAMLYDRMQQARPAIENKVRTAPKLVKPGQAVQNTQEQAVKNLKQSVIKSGGKQDRVVEYLLATGKA
jgi:hypothetical protein